jgi:BMFP domain-containing protein YqiC
MVQTTNRFFDEMARLMNDAAGVAKGARREVDTVIRAQAERILRDLDLVRREEFEAVKDMARLAREENEALKARLEALEAATNRSPGASPSVPAPSASAEPAVSEGKTARAPRRRAPPFL